VRERVVIGQGGGNKMVKGVKPNDWTMEGEVLDMLLRMKARADLVRKPGAEDDLDGGIGWGGVEEPSGEEQDDLRDVQDMLQVPERTLALVTGDAGGDAGGGGGGQGGGADGISIARLPGMRAPSTATRSALPTRAAGGGTGAATVWGGGQSSRVSADEEAAAAAAAFARSAAVARPAGGAAASLAGGEEAEQGEEDGGEWSVTELLGMEKQNHEERLRALGVDLDGGGGIPQLRQGEGGEPQTPYVAPSFEEWQRSLGEPATQGQVRGLDEWR